jgi:hypothetical protein
MSHDKPTSLTPCSSIRAREADHLLELDPVALRDADFLAHRLRVQALQLLRVLQNLEMEHRDLLPVTRRAADGLLDILDEHSFLQSRN